MSLHPGSLTIGNFALKFSPSGFGNSLTHSNRRPSNARWELFSERNENERRSSWSAIYWPTQAECSSLPKLSERLVKQGTTGFPVVASPQRLGSRRSLVALLRLTRTGNGDNEFAVFLRDKAFARAR